MNRLFNSDEKGCFGAMRLGNCRVIEENHSFIIKIITEFYSLIREHHHVMIQHNYHTSYLNYM